MKCLICNQDYVEENLLCPNCGNEQSSIQRWHWQDKAPGPQSVMAGKVWQFRLPLIGIGTVPRCQWTNLPGQQHITYSDNLMLNIKIPTDSKGILKLEYRIEGYEHLDGNLLLKVLPYRTVVATEETIKIDHPVASTLATVPSSDSGPIDLPEPSHQPNIQPQGSMPPSIANNPIPTDSPTSVLLVNPVCIKVFCATRSIPHLKTRLEPDQSLLIGKRSESRQIFPDIDLKGQFADSQQEKCCSHKQAKIYISNHRVFLQNLGKSPLKSEASQVLIPSGQPYNWQLNEIIQLPGGLKLLLSELL